VASGDLPVAVRLAGVGRFLQRYPSRCLHLCGRDEDLTGWWESQSKGIRERCELSLTPQVLQMCDGPAVALRRKRDSSMHRALDAVATGRASACVSAGNTAALMALARHILGRLPGIDRPAICSQFPSLHGCTYALDMGANLAASADQLFQFAIMGAAVAASLGKTPDPRVGLMNVGQEESKGSDSIRRAAMLLREGPLNYIGFVEGNDLFSGKADVIVCDGFSGNVALKASEGTARLIGKRIDQAFSANLWRRIQGRCVGKVLRRVEKDFDPRRFNGASLIGLRSVVIKSHGNSDACALANAIGVAAAEVDNGVLEQISLRIPRGADGDPV